MVIIISRVLNICAIITTKDLKDEKYYTWYTGFITVTSITISFSLLILIKAWTY